MAWYVNHDYILQICEILNILQLAGAFRWTKFKMIMITRMETISCAENVTLLDFKKFYGYYP